MQGEDTIYATQHLRNYMHFNVPVEVLCSINISPTHALNFTIYCDLCFYATKLDCVIRVYLMYLCSLFPLETILSCKPY